MSSNAADAAASRPGPLRPAASRAASTKSSTSVASAASSRNASSDKPADETGKLKVLLGVLRKFLGVADLAAVRFSLPAQLLEPTPNLEYWGYLDRPETFIAIPDHEDPLGRILGALRFWFTKDLKYVKAKPVKPYNSVLGEFFRCNWEVEDTSPSLRSSTSTPPRSSATSFRSAKSTYSDVPNRKVRISYLTEQTSHHPPVSAFYIDCPEKGISARGFDQLSAKFTGTSIRVTPGNHNLGIFIQLHKFDEQYQLTHPAAHVGGLLRGSLSVTVADQCFVTCPKTRIKVILHYIEEGWLGKSQNKVEGIIFHYDPDNDTITRIRDVPEKDILGRIEGSWQDKVYYTLGSSPKAEKHLLIDVNPLFPVPKIIPPEDKQLPNESLRFWSEVTQAIRSKQYSLATTLKVELEERQRQKAKARQEKGEEWQPRFFKGAVTPVGRPELTKEGEDALKALDEGRYELPERDEAGA